MGVTDKAVAMLRGHRLVDLVIARLETQSGQVMISGSRNFETGLRFIPDLATGPPGPVGAIYAVSAWLTENMPGADGFVTAPVDAPFFPDDLVARLTQNRTPAIAVDDNGLHPTFGFWTQATVKDALNDASSAPARNSLRALAERCKAAHCHWAGSDGFLNINTPEDLERARSRDLI